MSQFVAIDCQSVTKRFILDTTGALWSLVRASSTTPTFQALTDISLAVPKGELVGLLGRNGAGKSTLLRTAGGIHTPDRGHVRVNGRLAGLYELGISGNDHLDGAGFSRRWLDILAPGDVDIVALTAEIKDFSELGDAFKRPIRTYSSGMRARLFFAVATALPADVYVIDEMLSVGDEYFQHKCWRRLRERLKSGASGLLATHDWAAILKLCPTSYILEGGRVIATGPSPDVVRSYLGTALPPPTGGAVFAADLPTQITARSLEPFQLTVPFEVTSPDEVLIGASIERFLPGYGWDHMLHLPPTTTQAGLGKHTALISVPALHLPGAKYTLGLFLVTMAPDGTRSTADVRAWSYGNGLVLSVEGAPSRGAVRVPIRIEIVQ